jgi:hypothetical protein
MGERGGEQGVCVCQGYTPFETFTNFQILVTFSVQQTRERLKSLEEHVEAERASHLETKFNSEIVQVVYQLAFILCW